jgi:Nickel responsive protein SCO4226-like
LEGKIMPKFIVERVMPWAGDLTTSDWQVIAQKSCCVLGEMGTDIQWVSSYITDDKVYCIYIAPDEKTIREHSNRGEFPADSICKVRKIIDPTIVE